MRLLYRFILLTAAVFILLIYCIHLIVEAGRSGDGDDEADETVRILLMSDKGTNGEVPQVPSINAAIVLLVSLVSVALLITAIIFVAVSMDPTSPGSAKFRDDEQQIVEGDSAILDFYDSEAEEEAIIAAIDQKRSGPYAQEFPPVRAMLPDYEDLMVAKFYHRL